MLSTVQRDAVRERVLELARTDVQVRAAAFTGYW